jgi:hypothetical protein
MTAKCPYCDCGSRTEIPANLESGRMRCGACFRMIPATPILPLIPPNVLDRIQELEQENAQLRAQLERTP